jgi:imidazolonepropionase-like amidohydrolase
MKSQTRRFMASMATAIAAVLTVHPASADAGNGNEFSRRPLLIEADRIFDGARFAEGLAVLVRDGKIVRVAPPDQIQAGGARRLRVPGGTILPGFIDTHTHHLVNRVPAQRILNHGVTTARDLGGPVEPVTIEQPYQLRQFTSGPIITAPGGYPNVVFPGSGVEVTGMENVRAKVNELVGQGASVIAVSLEPGGEAGAPWSQHHGHGHGHGHGSQPPWPTLSDEELDAIVDEAHRLGVRVTAYLGEPEGVRRALDAGVDEWAHMPCDPLPSDLIERAGTAGVAITGTLDTLTRCTGVDHNAHRLFHEGARILYGTDLAHTDIPHGIDAQEIKLKLRAGMTIEQALASATSAAGRYLGIEPLGQLAPGAPADLIVIDGDPRANLKELEYPRVVVAGGRVVIKRAKGE